MGEQMISVSELAKLWDVSPSLIHRLINCQKDRLIGYKIGGKICIKVSDAEAFLTAHEIKAPEKPVAFPGMARFNYKPGMKVVSL